ncbi:MAG: SagB/ThcOx family dehydrogenase [Deltaproteobacteria bacterium]|nr:SagB/ThcOx family dehydrogenase [Deltaproteobacteria bacterium]
MQQTLLEQGRSFLKDTVRKTIDFSTTGQSRGVDPPPIEKPFAEGATRIDLVPPGSGWETIRRIDLAAAIQSRRSRRSYREEPLTIEELSFLLWATQGIRHRIDAGHAFRTVPSAGCRHALETYLCVLNITGIARGLYRYLPVEHQLLLEGTDDQLAERIVEASFGQQYPGEAAVTFLWTAVPYRMEWRYGGAAHKVIALDAGHVGQNLYLACEAIGAGTCAIAAYDQEAMDRLVGVDGTDEFVIYLAPVGKVAN